MDASSYNRQCTICDSYFPNRVSLAKHTKNHEEGFEHRCTYCDMGPFNIKFLRDHERSHVNRPDEDDDGYRVEQRCKCCEFGLFWNDDLAKHTKNHEESFEHRCTYCDMGPFSLKFLRDHERSHVNRPDEEDDGYRVEQRCKCCEFGLFWNDDLAKAEEHQLVGEAWTFERRCRFCPYGPGVEKLIRDHEARHEEFEDEEVLKEEEEGESDDDEIREIQSDDDEITEVYNDEDGDEDYDDDDEIEVLPEPSNNIEVIEEDEIEEVDADEEVEEVTSDDEIQEIREQRPSEDLNNSIIFDFDDSLFEEPSRKKEEKMVIDDDEGIEEICNVKAIRISERRPEIITKPRNFKTKDEFERNAKAKEVPQKLNHKTSNMVTEDTVEIEPSNRRRSKGKAQNQRSASIGTIVELNGPSTKDEDFVSVIEEDEIGGRDEALKLKRQEFEKQSRWARIDDATKKRLIKVTGESEEELKTWFKKRRQLQSFNSE